MAGGCSLTMLTFASGITQPLPEVFEFDLKLAFAAQGKVAASLRHKVAWPLPMTL